MTALEIPLSLKAHVNGHYGFRRELPTGPLAVRSPPTLIRPYPPLALPPAGVTLRHPRPADHREEAERPARRDGDLAAQGGHFTPEPMRSSHGPTNPPDVSNPASSRSTSAHTWSRSCLGTAASI